MGGEGRRRSKKRAILSSAALTPFRRSAYSCGREQNAKMDFELTEEQRAFQATAREFARAEFAPRAKEWDEKYVFPVESLRKAAALGFGGMYIREDVGGSNLTRLDAAIIFEELAQGCTSTAAYLSIHNMATWMIDGFGGEAQRKRFLPKLCTMEHCASYCLTEPDAGSDAASLKASAKRDGDHYVLNGSKAFISGAGNSHIYVCMVRTGGAGPTGISCIVVEKGTPGLSFGKQEVKLGWHSQPTAMVIFENCRVPVENRIGPEGIGFKVAMAGPRRRPHQYRRLFARRRAVLPRPHDRIHARAQAIRRPPRGFPGVALQDRRLCHRTRGGAALLWKAAMKVEAKTPDARRFASMAKRRATDDCFDIVNGCLQIHGGYGFLARFSVRARAARSARAPNSRRHQRNHARDRQPRFVGELGAGHDHRRSCVRDSDRFRRRRESM